ncbi:MAG: TolC family protein [Pirellulales bacterium]
MPASFNGATSPDNSADLAPPEFFQDPRLTSLIDQALVGNQELRILAQDIAIANNEVLRRRGAYLPFFTGGLTNISYNKYSDYTPFGSDLNQIVKPGGGLFPNPLPDYLIGANVSWQVDIWRQLRNARDAASLRYLGTVDGRNFVVTRMVAEIAQNYYKLMAYDNQLATLDATIALQEQSLTMARAQMEAARGTELGVQRFLAEVQKNQSQKLIIRQAIVETENRINFLCGRYPQPVDRDSANFIELHLQALKVGVPSQLLQNRPDVVQAERTLAAAGLDVRVARANFFPKMIITAGVGYEAFDPKFLFYTPESLIYGVAGNLVAPLINRSAIKAEYLNADARQLQALYDYQRTILNAFTEVVNQITKVQNYSQSIAIKRQQLASLEAAVDVAGKLFQNARVEYMDVLFAQRDRNEARIVLIETKQEQLAGIVNAYQALGGGWRYVGSPIQTPPEGLPGNPFPAQDSAVPAAPPPEEVPPPQPAATQEDNAGGPMMPSP